MTTVKISKFVFWKLIAILFYFPVKSECKNCIYFMIFPFFTGEHVAQFKFTVLMMPNGPHRITGLPFEEELFSSEHSVKDADIQVRLLFCILNNTLIEEYRSIIFSRYFYQTKIHDRKGDSELRSLISLIFMKIGRSWKYILRFSHLYIYLTYSLKNVRSTNFYFRQLAQKMTSWFDRFYIFWFACIYIYRTNQDIIFWIKWWNKWVLLKNSNM